MHTERGEIASEIKNAKKLHGHLGPFLVIGVRMGIIAKKTLDVSAKQHIKLRANAKIPLKPPFSCVLDGIQATTTCTVGNQRLVIENSAEEITVDFEMRNSDRRVRLSVSPSIMEELNKKISEGPLTEKCAWDIVHMPEDQLFTVEIQ